VTATLEAPSAQAGPKVAGRRQFPLRSRQQRWVAVAALAALLAGGGVWLASGSSAASYRWTTASMSDVTQTLNSYGTISPIQQAAVAFPVAGTVKSVSVKVGQTVTSGTTLAALDTTALQSSLDAARSTLATAQNRLATDTQAQASGTTVAATTQAAVTSGATAVLTAAQVPSGNGGADTSALKTAVSAAQSKLLNDQQSLDGLLTTLATDVRTGSSTCSSLIQTLRGLIPSQPAPSPSTGAASPSAPAGGTAVPDGSSCTNLLSQALTDQQSVSAAQSTVSSDETALTNAVAALEAAGGSTPVPKPGPTPTPTPTPSTTPSTGGSSRRSGGSTGAEGFGGSSSSDFGSGTFGSGSSNRGGGGGGGGTYVTAQQLVVDQATVDADAADVTVAEQALKQATVVSPLNGTVAAVAIAPGGSVSARTAAVTVIGHGQDEVTTTVGDLQLDQVTIGERATVLPDGSSRPIQGRVTAIGLLPVTSATSSPATNSGATSSASSATTSATYPVTIGLPVGGLFSGSGANVSIIVKQTSHVLTVPTSAVTTLGTRRIVMTESKGKPTRTIVQVGAVDAIRTEITSGLKSGDKVALARLNEPLPSSSGTLTNRGGFAGAGGAGVGGAGTGRFSRVATASRG
jgi:multidrug efflux pump subunit AcrA (membrane-fusion protein)